MKKSTLCAILSCLALFCAFFQPTKVQAACPEVPFTDDLFTSGTITNDENGNFIITVTVAALAVNTPYTVTADVSLSSGCTATGSISIDADQTETLTVSSSTCDCPIAGPTLSGDITITIVDNISQQVSITIVPYTLCCPNFMCAHSVGFWACNTDDWPVDPNTEICTVFEAILDDGDPCAPCDPSLTLLDIIESPSTSAWYCLAKQFVAAYLNIIDFYGVTPPDPAYVDCIGCPACLGEHLCLNGNAFDEAAEELAATICTKGSIDPDLALCLRKRLESFNMGLLEDATCPEACNPCSGCEACPTCEQCRELSSCPVDCFRCKRECGFSSSSSSSSSSTSRRPPFYLK